MEHRVKNDFEISPDPGICDEGGQSEQEPVQPPVDAAEPEPDETELSYNRIGDVAALGGLTNLKNLLLCNCNNNNKMPIM